MPRKLIMVAAGEALLDETGQKPGPGGLAMRAAWHAVRLGHTGVVVSRVGQDQGAQTLLDLAREMGVDVNHVQSDPDLPTGRRWTQRLGGGDAQIDERAAFDNLQWDHDLVDLAMRSHVIVTGALARRSGQARAEIDRFVSEGRTALKLFDLCNRQPDRFERSEQLAMLELVDGVVIDRVAADVIMPAKRNATLVAAAREILREFRIEFAVLLEAGVVTLVMKDASATEELANSNTIDRELLTMALLHFIAHGCNAEACVSRAVKVVRHAQSQQAQPIDASLLEVS